MPKVSVIIPVFGVEKYIEKSAHSLFEQTLDDIEYIFVDDCCTDNSISILMSVLENYPHRKDQVIIHRMETNSGQAKVRRWGMEKASGEYIIHCDSDDWVDKQMYEDLYIAATKSNADIALCNYIIEGGKYNEKVVKRRIIDVDKLFIIKKLLTGPYYNALWVTLVKREILSKIDFPVGNHSEDKTMMIQMCWFANTIIGIDKAYYHYRFNQCSISNTIDLKSRELKANQILSNSEIIVRFVEREKLLRKRIGFAYNAYLFSAKFPLMNLFEIQGNYKRWCSLFHDETKYFLFNPFISFKTKVAALKFLLYYYYKYYFKL